MHIRNVAMLMFSSIACVGCDTLHGFQIEAVSATRECVIAGLAKVGLDLRDSAVVERGGRGAWFFADFFKPFARHSVFVFHA